MSLLEIGFTLSEIGILLVLSLGVSHILKKFDVPTVLGLILGGLLINILFLLSSYSLGDLFTDIPALKGIVTELALAWIGYEIGSHMDLNLIKANSLKYGLILIGEAVGAFLVVAIGFFYLLNDLGIALLLGSIAMATAPAATSQVLKEYGAQGELTQTILFIVAFDDILSILFANVSLGVIELDKSGGNIISNLLEAVLHVFFDILLSLLLGILGAVVILAFLRLLIINEGTLLEWLLGVSFILIAASLVLDISVIMTMFIWGLSLKIFEDKKVFIILQQHIKKLEVLTVPIILLFFILIGLSMEIDILIQISTLGFAIAYFVLRLIGKFTGTYLICTITNAVPHVKNNLPISLLTQAGIAIGLVGLAFQKLIELGRNEMAFFLINIVGVSVILSEIFGPFLLKEALNRSGEGKLNKITHIKQLNLD